MGIENVDKTLRIIWNLDDKGNKVSIPISNETHVVVNGKITLLEIPDAFYGVQITNLNEIDPTDSETEIIESKFRVNYGLGVIFLHKSLEGKTLSINYSSRGSIMYPASRIYTHVNEVDGSVTNLQDIVDDVNKASTDLQNLGNIVSEGQRLEGVLTTKNEEGNQTNQILNTSINSAETTKIDLESTTNTAINKKNQLTEEIGKANNSYISLHDEIGKADAFMNTKKDEAISKINTHVESKKSEIDDFIGDDNNPASGTVKKEINDFVASKEIQLSQRTDILKEDLNSYKSQKESEIDTYTTNQLNTHTDTKKSELDDYVGTNDNPFNGTKKKDLDNYTIIKKSELDSKMSQADTKIGEINNKIIEANTIKSNLDGSISIATTKKSEIDASISTATVKKSNLDNTISTVNEKHITLQGDIGQANGKIAEMDNLNQRVSVYEDYNANTAYYAQNKVLYKGNTYLVLKEIVGITPVDDGVNYKLIVQGVKSNDAVNIQTDATHRFITDAERSKWDDTYSRNEVENKITQAVKQLDWKEAVAKFEDLVKTYKDAEEGWTASVNNEDKVYRFDGTDWRQISESEIPLATHVLDGKMSFIDKTKIDGIEDNANNYIHPSNHSMDIMTETPTKKIMTSTERSKLNGIENNANNYTHPLSHSADVITQDATHRFVTDIEKSNWNNKAESNHNHTELHNHPNMTVLNNLIDDNGSLKYKGKSINNSKVMYFTKSGTLTTETNHIPIDIPEFNEGNDFLVVTIGGIIKTKDTEYTIVDGNKIQKVDDGTGAKWDNGTQYDFICMKSVEIKDEELQDGTIIKDGTIAKSKLNQEVKSLLEHSNVNVLNELSDNAGKLKYKGKPIISEEKSRAIHVSTTEPTNSDGEDGDIWVVYEE